MKRLIPAVLLVLTAAPLSAADYPFTVKVVGQGKPMILIPGLGSSGEVWDSTVAHFKDKYECHVLTLAGFAGQKPLAEDRPYLDTIAQGIVQYIRDKKLEKPAIVGHSLGACLTFRIGAAAPDLVGPLVAVDGFPNNVEVFLADMPAEGREGMIKGMLAGLSTPNREEFVATMEKMFGQWLEGEKLKTAMKWLAASDQKTIAKAMGELFRTDGRKGLEKVESPVLVLAAYHKDQEKFIPSQDVYTKRIEAQLKKVPGAKVAVKENCKHFIMYDEPKWMFDQMAAVLK
jgi:pimeloyl-ACP methyl ester carboxylesterase